MFKITKRNNKIYSAFETLSDQVCSELEDAFDNYPAKQANTGPLMGRSHVHKFTTSLLGDLVIKPYRRGGLWSLFNSDSYIRGKYARPEIEYQMLVKVKDLGIHVPEPIASITSEGWLYRGWLVMRDLREKSNLIELSINNRAQIPELMAKLCAYVRILVENRICHVDLHPGNVVLDQEDNLYIIDFDKAYIFKGDLHNLRDYYLCRWRRAVIKHNLSQELVEHFCMGLRHNFNKNTYECAESATA